MQTQQTTTNTEFKPLVPKGYKHIAPIGTKLRAFIEHRVITTVSEFEDFKKAHSEFSDFLEDVFMEMIDSGTISVDENTIKFNNGAVWSTNDPSMLLKSLPELSREIIKKSLKDRAQGTHNEFLDFARVVHFADDPEVTARAAAILQRCAMELKSLSAMTSTRAKNQKVRAVVFAGGFLEEGDSV